MHQELLSKKRNLVEYRAPPRPIANRFLVWRVELLHTKSPSTMN
jgi:hypothetical protein